MDKTIGEYLNMLPEPQRSAALKNAVPSSLAHKTLNIHIAVSSSFTWSQSPEGHEYWANFANQLRKEQAS